MYIYVLVIINLKVYYLQGRLTTYPEMVSVMESM